MLEVLHFTLMKVPFLDFSSLLMMSKASLFIDGMLRELLSFQRGKLAIEQDKSDTIAIRESIKEFISLLCSS
jgi:hypothetical protein